MTPNEPNRLDLISSLLELSISLDELTKELNKFPWDYDGKGVELTRIHLSRILERYLKDELSENEIEQWANMIECREDICFEKGFERHIDKILHELANPILFEPLNKGLAQILFRKLSIR
jgi:hypothetical protein